MTDGIEMKSKMLKTYVFSYTAGSGVPAPKARSLPEKEIAGQVAQRDGQVGRSTQNRRVIMRVTQDMRVNTRVEVAEFIQQTGLSRVERVVVTRIDPLKAMQVVDFPDIGENKGFQRKDAETQRKTKSNETGPTARHMNENGTLALTLSQWLPKPATSQLPKGDVRFAKRGPPERVDPWKIWTWWRGASSALRAMGADEMKGTRDTTTL